MGFLGLVGSLVVAGLLPPLPSPQPVTGGSDVAVCGWPTAVRLSSGCSATLVHPQVVLYAAHCGAGATSITVGEDGTMGTDYAVDQCWVSPSYGGSAGTDFATCRLAAPVPDIPIVPIMMGCELQLLEVGVPVTTVGSGATVGGPAGIKREVTYPIAGFDLDANELNAGGGDDDGVLCGGDSGGGTYMQGLDGSWRMVAVSSAVAGTPCDHGASVLGLAAGAVAWVETQTGFDVSPCYDADGTWNPDDRCTEAPLDPATGGGDWPTCEWGGLSGPLSTCGVPFEGEDLVAPVVTITAPVDGETMIVPDDAPVPLTVTFDVDDGAGFGVTHTHLRINGRDVPGTDDDWMPWEIPQIQLVVGEWTVEVVAEDWAGNVAVSRPVLLTIEIEGAGEESGEDGLDDGTGDSGEDDDGGSTDDGGDAAESDEDDGGGDETGGATTEPAADDGGSSNSRGCSVGGERIGSWLLWLFALGALKRRTKCVKSRVQGASPN